MKTSQITFTKHFAKEIEGTYFEVPFDVPENVCRIDIEYAYPRHVEVQDGNGITLRKEINIIDLSLRDGNDEYVGNSGSNRSHIYVSAWDSAQGYTRTNTDAGRWAIIVGAYKIDPAGVDVTYTVTFTHRELMELRGDTHMHTLGSDGAQSVRDTALMAKANGLDYIFVTDHNNYSHNLSLPEVEGMIIMPGTEWTHFRGHSGMLGVPRPFKSAFCVNSKEEAWAKLAEARSRGALVVLNHPFCPNCGWHFGMDEGGYDLVELINGATTPQANAQCRQWWHERLCQGKKIPVIGGSDFHRPEPNHLIGEPTTAILTMSRSPRDILSAIKAGNSYILMDPKGPRLQMTAGKAILGQTAPRGTPVSITLRGMWKGDIVQIVTDQGQEQIPCESDIFKMELERTYDSAKFVRVEIVRNGAIAMISNPIYFE